MNQPAYSLPSPAFRDSSNRISLGPVDVDTTPREAIITAMLEDAFNGTSTSLVATINAQLYVLAERDHVYRNCLKRARFLCADGSSIGLAAFLLAGQRLERLAGVDLVDELCRRGCQRGLRIFLLGGREGSAMRLSQLLATRHPGLRIVGMSCPPIGFEKSRHTLVPVLNQIRAANPHGVFVALGAPKQELFIDQYLRQLSVPLAIGVGGSFEIITGVTRRAPHIVQRLGMEWFYRLIQEPRRLWRRYLFGNLHFLWILGKYYFSRKRTPHLQSISGRRPKDSRKAS